MRVVVVTGATVVVVTGVAVAVVVGVVADFDVPVAPVPVPVRVMVEVVTAVVAELDAVEEDVIVAPAGIEATVVVCDLALFATNATSSADATPEPTKMACAIRRILANRWSRCWVVRRVGVMASIVVGLAKPTLAAG
jgi:hypothetical protein